VASGISSFTYTGTTPITANAWTHIATVRNGTSLTHYINGVIDAGGSFNIGTQTLFYYNGAAKDLRIGIGGDLGSPFAGIISDFRIVKGTAVYTANFTRPTTRLTAITNTLLLTCQQDSIRDYSNNNFSVSALGDARVTSNTQFGVSPTVITTPYASGTILNSMSFDGTGDYLLCPTNPNFSFGTGDFTIECWIYVTAAFGTTSPGRAALISNRAAAAGETSYFLQHYNGKIYFGTPTTDIIVGGTTMSINTWYHVAVTRSSGTVRLFLNGVSDATAVTGNTTNFSDTNAVYVGCAGSYLVPLFPYTGYITDLRITKGVARYTANFTVPIAPPPTR
jgi:hypothetical protein